MPFLPFLPMVLFYAALCGLLVEGCPFTLPGASEELGKSL